MALATAPKLAAGTVLSFEDTTFKDLINLIGIPAIGNKGEFVETTPISSVDATYIAGRRKGEEAELKFNDVPGDADQETFLGFAAAGDTVNMQVITTTGRQGAFALALNGWKMDEPDGDAQLTLTVFAQKTGATTWTDAA